MSDLWYCDPSSDVRKCRAVPCHGHRVTREQHLVARVLAFLDGVNWWDGYRPEHMPWWRKAYETLKLMRADSEQNRLV